MKRAIQAVALAAVAGLLALLVWKVVHKPASVYAELNKGQRPEAPDFALRRLDDGRVVSLASLRGKPVVLDFWASWCWTCPRQSERLERAVKRYPNVVALGINTEDSSSRARRWLARYKITYPSVHDNGKVLRRWVGAVRLPSMFFIDRGGRVVGQMEVEEDLGRYLKQIAQAS